MLLTPNPRERDTVTAYRECGIGWEWSVALPGRELGRLSTPCVPGMTMEMAGTLMGATVHGLIVSGAHSPHRCEDAEFPGPVAVSPNAVSAHAARPLRVLPLDLLLLHLGAF